THPSGPREDSFMPTSRPSRMPTTVASTVVNSPIIRLLVVAATVRENTSMPAESVPNRCSPPGDRSGFATTSIGLNGTSAGPATATATTSTPRAGTMSPPARRHIAVGVTSLVSVGFSSDTSVGALSPSAGVGSVTTLISGSFDSDAGSPPRVEHHVHHVDDEEHQQGDRGD